MPQSPIPRIRLLERIDHVLRGQDANRSKPASTTRQLAAILIAAGCLYGAVMGTFGGIGPSRIPQILYSAIKVPLLLLATFSISLPGFFVINTLLGLRSDFRQAIRALGGAQAALTVILASLAPFTAFWYLSIRDYHDAILFNTAMFAIASISAQWVLRRSYQSLVMRDRRHRWMLRGWLLIYAFVGIQMGWVLRPFVGDPVLPTRFLRPDPMSNAYVYVIRMIWDKLR
jgi:hypothetical protein